LHFLSYILLKKEQAKLHETDFLFFWTTRTQQNYLKHFSNKNQGYLLASCKCHEVFNFNEGRLRLSLNVVTFEK